jgi:hypothetical protein
MTFLLVWVASDLLPPLPGVHQWWHHFRLYCLGSLVSLMLSLTVLFSWLSWLFWWLGVVDGFSSPLPCTPNISLVLFLVLG